MTDLPSLILYESYLQVYVRTIQTEGVHSVSHADELTLAPSGGGNVKSLWEQNTSEADVSH